MNMPRTDRTGPVSIGDVSVAHVPEWEGSLFTRSGLLPDSSREAWEEERPWLEPLWWAPDSDRALLCIGSFLVRGGGRTILVDSGVGNGKPYPDVPPLDRLSTPYLEHLAALGVRPEDVDLVINTHLHPDHIGWNTMWEDGAWRPTFPNATYLLPRTEVDLLSAMAEDPGRPDPLGLVPAFRDSVVPVLRDARTEVWSGTEHVVDDALKLVAAPGHSPGSSVLTITSGGESAALVGDLIHHPMQILDPRQRDVLDDDVVAARQSRVKILGWAADTSAWVFGGHFHGGRGARIREAAGGFAIDSWTSD
ncbi:MBL fold metallo-hydrolase [Streptomyces liangshanensis]|uniref:MBL fold metallo-hydrolase n=1 Tax=Streptomyces liangshanensis TaxID=2717324 RepID=A0A6G9GTC3_9ACTN|nr:MBL fold metallo-hydrolase [Streptomyces liangshanensis]QIQ01271.1 MBL fold metallo-hydrolase [Streptomyces liangshanensis]